MERKIDTEIEGSAFAELLHWLDANTQRAAEQYERLRWRLTEFFAHQGCYIAEELVDTTLDRVARILQRNEKPIGVSPLAYCYGVARNVLNEYWRRSERRVVQLDQLPVSQHPVVTPPSEDQLWEEPRQLACLERCLQRLAPDQRQLLKRYYQDDDQTRIQERNALAAEEGISLAAMHVRVHRLKRRLVACLERCCQETKI